MVEAQIMQRIREGDIYYPDNHNGMERFADKDSYNLGNPLRESKDTAIIFTALCARAAMEGGLSPALRNSWRCSTSVLLNNVPT